MARNIADRPRLEFVHHAFRDHIGVARRDITPPVGIYARNWAFLKDGLTTTGTHRPLTVSAAVFRSADRGRPPLVLVSVDGSWFKNPSDEWQIIRGPVIAALNLPQSNLILAYTHTHAGNSLSSSESGCPGGQSIVPHMKHISHQIIEAIREADVNCRPATLTWATGRCDLAVIRDQVDPDMKRRRLIVGFDPDAAADDTLLVGRITRDEDGAIIGTILNYACHPTTLAWQNHLASPDYVGPARALVEAHTGGAPCLFLQGASGELAPRRQYTADLAIAESNGRQLGYAALSTLESMLMSGHATRFDSVVESGAPLGVWKQQPFAVSSNLYGEMIQVKLPLKKRPSLAELREKIEHSQDPTLRERLGRDLRIGQFVGEGAECAMPAWVWRLGDSLLIAQPNEAYSDFQRALRSCFPDFSLAVLNVANGWCGYLPPRDFYDVDAYQVWQTPFAAGSLE